MALFLNWSLSDQVRPFSWTSASSIKRHQEIPKKHISASADLIARPPSINDVINVFLDNEEGPLLLGKNKSSAVPTAMFEEAVVGRVACNGSNTTSFTSSWLDCYGANDSYLTGNATLGNGTGMGGGAGADEALTDAILMGVTSVVLGLMILVTVIGNVFVIAAILLERNLQNVANYLIVSLAVADLMVACLVMPLGAVYEISKGWILGPELCDMWTSSDVLCCTASILHLVAIAVDRYWAVTNVDYIHTRNGNRIGAMIVVVWAVALIVSLAPQFGWKDPEYLDRINKQQRCLPSQDVGYQIFATCSTFYVPLLVILVLYWKIFQTARKRIHRRQRPRPPPTAPSQASQQASNNTPSLQQAGTPGTLAVSRFITKRRFRRITSSSNKKKKSSASEALVSSLAMVEGGHSTSTSVQDVGLECDDDVANSCGSGPKTGATSEEDEEEPTSGEATTAFTITRNPETGGTTATTSNNVSPEKSSAATTTNNGSASHQSHISDMSRVEILHKDNPPPSATPASARGVGGVKERLLLAAAAAAGGGAAGAAAACHMQRRDKKESLEAKRERKAAKTLAIITGAFVVCWLPFFIMALLMPLCSACVINDYMASFFLWLGYFNSTLNPVIYTIFSPEFRQAFKRILCGTAGSGRSRNFRPGKLR